MSTNNIEQQPQPSQKRGLPLDDIVNHEQDEKIQKLSSETGKTNDEGSNTRRQLPSIANLVTEEPERPIANPPPIAQPVNKQTYDDSDTDTDDNGEINFDSSMAFDYDKQDNPSPEKPKPKQSTSKSKASNASEIKEKPKPQTTTVGISSKPTEDTDIQQDKIETQTQDKIETPTQEIQPTGTNGTQKKKETKKEASNDDIVNNATQASKSKSKGEKKGNLENVKNIFDEKTTTKSKRNNIKKDLQLLQEINASSKPNKYKNAPTWAQKWKPSVKALETIDTSDLKLDQSILNFIPDDDLTKSVQDWVYATIYSIDPELRQFIEFEMKFGLIISGNGPDRVSPPISTQAVYTEMDAHLTPNVDQILFTEIIKYIKGLTILNENGGKFSTIESQTTDSVYRVGVSTQRPRFLRMSTDVKTGRVGQFIEKRHVAQLMLYSPKDNYDVKLSINLELPVPENEPPEKYKDEEPINQRTKERISFIHNDSCTRFDLTKVANHKQGIKGKDTEITHEIELEINTPALLNAFDNITTNGNEYASIIRTFLSNGSIVRRKLSSLSYSIYEGSKKIVQ